MTLDLTDRKSFFSRCRRLVIKVGSAVLTGPRGLNRVMIHRLSDQIAELRERNGDCQIVIVTSGAVASGVRKIGLSERPRTIPHKQATAAVGQGVLMESWEAAFDKYELLVAQLLLTSEDLAHRHRYLNARNTLETLLDWGILPIINENDTVVVEEIKFGDNDQLSAMIAGLIGADLVINLTDTQGLYDCDPRTHASARLIPVVNRVDAKLLACATPQPGAVGTGGMLSKVNAARKCLASGIPMIIAPGKERDILLRLFEGEELGTLFLPRKRLYHGKKLWLANLPKPAGDLILDDGAVLALQKRGKSLLPIGIREIRGTFGVGTPVRCLDQAGNVIGIGLCNYRSTEIDQIKGRHTEEIEGIIGYKHSDEVIHRNNFVLSGEDIEEERAEGGTDA
ncbi:glutamate 5-kinase [Desulforhabdus amnigena]|uniref:Glutamate 5-kinase n=1 Tax=Desulforhabdus amnigena TaxID=40218 RepID=A0A9W6FT37_9BACT|nr:glutamate 5-kinase [Desulforhabdus amnigena]GLI34788.1 glutamate 5-kinase [Desulforhabdus amnigena]